MSDRWIAWVPALLLAGLAALTYWLDQRVQPLGPVRDGSHNEPDFVVENFNAVRLSPEGQARYAVRARRMVHYPDDSSTLLDYPELTHFDPQKSPVTIRANQGHLSKNGQNAYFSGDVQVRRAPYGTNPEMALYTSYLHVIPEQERAKTDREVTLVSGNSRLKSVGLEFDNKARTLTLLANVKGSYDTPRKARLALPWEGRR
jgi:lipopolysaccharide export system protein LptC